MTIMRWRLTIVFVLTVNTAISVYGFTVEDETLLRQELLANYSRFVRPSGQTVVTVSFDLTAISGLNLRRQEFSVVGWWALHWNDSRLTWDKVKNNIPAIQIYDDEIWTPVLVVDNSVNDLSAIDEDSIPLRVDSTGLVTWSPPGLLSVSCDMDITHYPFDSQVCVLQVTSFGYTIQELDLHVYEDGLNLKYYGGNGEWTLVRTWSNRAKYTDEAYEYDRVYYYFRLTRLPLYYVINMILPLLVTAVLISLVFVLPAESGEKIGYCLTVMLSFMVILTLIAGELPTTATNTSLLAVYMAIVLIMSCLSVVLSIFVMEIYHRPDEAPIPKFVQKLTFLGMRINCYNAACCKTRPNEVDDTVAVPTALSYTSYTEYQQDSEININVKSEQENNCGESLPRNRWTGLLSDLNLRPVTPQSSPEDISRGYEITWKTVSIVLDGFLFRFYVLTFIVVSAVLLTLLVSNRVMTPLL